jgi:hypothetical protein
MPAQTKSVAEQPGCRSWRGYKGHVRESRRECEAFVRLPLPVGALSWLVVQETPDVIPHLGEMATSTQDHAHSDRCCRREPDDSS